MKGEIRTHEIYIWSGQKRQKNILLCKRFRNGTEWATMHQILKAQGHAKQSSQHNPSHCKDPSVLHGFSLWQRPDIKFRGFYEVRRTVRALLRLFNVCKKWLSHRFLQRGKKQYRQLIFAGSIRTIQLPAQKWRGSIFISAWWWNYIIIIIIIIIKFLIIIIINFIS